MLHEYDIKSRKPDVYPEMTTEMVSKFCLSFGACTVNPNWDDLSEFNAVVQVEAENCVCIKTKCSYAPWISHQTCSCVFSQAVL